MKSGRSLLKGSTLSRIAVAIAILALAGIGSVRGAESPERMEAKHLKQQAQTHRDYERDAHKLPYADSPADRLDAWPAAQFGQTSIIEDNFSVAAGINNVTNGPGLKMAATEYDLQQNDAVPHMCGTLGSGSADRYVHFVWTQWNGSCGGGGCAGRFINFNTFNSSTGMFLHGLDGATISGAGCDPFQAWAGFGTLDVDDNNRADIGAQQKDCPRQPSGDFSSWVWSQSAPNFPVFTEQMLSGSEGVAGNLTDDIIYPHLTVDRQAGTDWMYVVSHTESANDHIAFWRWNGAVWQGPYVIDSTHFLSYNIAADPTGNRIALITANDWVTPSNPLGLNQVVYRSSLVRGDDWGPVNMTGLGDIQRVFVTNYIDAIGPAAWTEVVGDYDNSGNLHIVWVEQKRNGIGDQASLKHWDATSGTIATIHQAGWYNQGQNSARKLNVGFPSIGFGDGSTTCSGGNNLNYVYVTFVGFGGPAAILQGDMSSKGYMNGDIYLSGSRDGGLHWSPALDLTNTHKPGCDPALADSCPSENWPSLARTVNDTLHVMYIDDKDAGDAVLGQGGWTLNPVMYYRIPGGTDVQPVCPRIAPNASATLTDANGPDCEYHAPPNGSVHESLILSNAGNATMTGVISRTYLIPPTGAWLSITTGSYTIPAGGADLNYPVAMNAPPVEGLYSAKISVTHNDPTKTSPFEIPVDFFVFNSFSCPEYVVLHTKWLELEVSNLERVADGPNRSSGQLRGLYRAPRFGQADSGNNSIYDASLIIAKTPSPDTVVYRYLFGSGNYAKGFRSLSGLTVDTSRYGTGSGMAYARAKQTTVDSIIGIDVEYQFPQNPDSSNFVLVAYRLFNRTTSAISGLIVGEAADFDVVPSTQNRIYQAGHNNTAGFDATMNLIYQQGADSGATAQAGKYLGGMTAIQCSASPRAWSAPNDPLLFTRPGGGFSEGYLYQQLVNNGFAIIPESPPSSTGSDRHSVIAFERNVTLSTTGVKNYMLGFVTSTAGPTNTDLVTTTRKAWKTAFGWQTVTTRDTLPPNTARSYSYWAMGSHENGPASGCCGCVVSKISDPTGKFTLTPDADNCTGTINFAGGGGGIYSATFRVATPSCAGPTYTDDYTVTIAVETPCSCPWQGDFSQDGSFDVFDIIELIGIVFNNGTIVQDPYCPTPRADVNNDRAVDVLDLCYLFQTAFSFGPAPVDPCTTPVADLKREDSRNMLASSSATGAALQAGQVIVESKMVAKGSETTIGIAVNNSTAIRQFVCPLQIRSLSGGAYISALTARRTPGGRLASALTGINIISTYPNPDGTCNNGLPGGYATKGTPDFVSPDGVLFSAGQMPISDPVLSPGVDPPSGSLQLLMTVTNALGQLEVDTTCTNPGNHLMMVDLNCLLSVPAFTKGIITVACDCSQHMTGDIDNNGIPNVFDVNTLIDYVFAGGAQPVKDPLCPHVDRSDVNCDGISNVFDVIYEIDYVFNNGPEPCDPCACTSYPTQCH